MTRTQRREQMLGHVAAWQASGKSRKEYCAAHGLALQTFHGWCRRGAGPAPAGFAQVEIASGASMELHYPNGVRLVLSAGTAMEHIAACIRLY